MEEEKEETKKKKMRGAMAMAESQSQSLGWLTESSIMPKKHKAINGVGASSILQLKAQLYKSQEEAKSSKPPSSSSDDLPYRSVAKHKPPLRHDLFSHKNSGVDSRAHNLARWISKLCKALEKKAELYDKLVRGELSDEEEKEKYSVDFFHKGLEEDQSEQSTRRSDSYSKFCEKMKVMIPPDFLMLSWKDLARLLLEWIRMNTSALEVHEEASQAREKASALKLRREEQAAARREKLKQAYLKKRLESLKAAEKKNGP
ncbi:hypothetical protein Scep_027265 [Stephania cephalantha]|uniref:Uncharacterized protein n=1 Tax=Stephania cephalantha TaxID=152367 RepID=A0AAP0HH40_9MAGN